MKLRIKGNSLRMRLSQTEVKDIAEGKEVVDQICFLPNAVMKYTLYSHPESPDITAQFSQGEIRVGLPKATAQKWANGNENALKGSQDNGDSDKLFLLVEKDFTCLKTRENENEHESDLFPNPNKAHGSCS
jgi:hypothetical protein